MQRSSSHISSLDLCRGLAALVVMLYHAGFLFFEVGSLFPRGYLCVDFFFLLSGYVIAISYDKRIAAGFGLVSFFLVRVARLWPLVLLATVVSFIVQLPRFQRDIPGLSTPDLVVSLAFNMVMLPSPKSPLDFLFPFDGAAWSIFFEMIANLVYVGLFSFLSGHLLCGFTLGAGIILAWGATSFNSLDIGMTGATFLFGFPRVLFSFFLGILLFRKRDVICGVWPPNSIPFFLFSLIVAGIIVSVPKMPYPYTNGLIDLLIVTLVFPMLLVVAVGTKITGPINLAAWFLGGISYSLYLFQTPIIIAYSALTQLLFGQKIAAFIPWAGVVFISIVLPVSYLSWIYFEKPSQRWLRDIVFRVRSDTGARGARPRQTSTN